MLATLRNIAKFLVNVFDKQCQFYLSLFIVFLPYYSSFVMLKESGIVVFFANVFLIYILSFIVSLFPRFIRLFLKIIIGTYYLAFSILSFYGVFFLKTRDAFYILSLILQTNTNEASQFIDMYVNGKTYLVTFLMLSLLTALIVVVLCKARELCCKLRFRYKFYLVALNVICCCCFCVPNISYSTPIFSMFEKSFVNFVPRKIRDCQVNPGIENDKELRPHYVVLIIGESFSKSHSSLYGYEKNTNPKLEKLREEGKLVVFDNVTSSQGATGMSFRDIMSTFSYRKADKDWTKCASIPTVMKYEGYYTCWISNQQCSGLWDAIPEQYSKLCDTCEFTKPGINYDGLLIPIIRRQKSNLLEKERVFVVVHLMGSHEAFGLRYPKNFNVFQTTDYMNFPINQREQRAKYDNAILYNDYVVSQIISLFSDDDCVLFYFPDHALDIYESDSTYVGHSTSNPKSIDVCKQIPFVIYISDIYKLRFLDNVQRISDSSHKVFCTQDFIYSLMDITGYKFSANDDVYRYSMFSN